MRCALWNSLRGLANEHLWRYVHMRTVPLPSFATGFPRATIRRARASVAVFFAAGMIGSALLATPAAAAETMHVASINVQLFGSPKPKDAEFTVVIQDQSGQPVANAEVDAYVYNGNSTRYTQGQTDQTGSVLMSTGGDLKGRSFTISVTY